VSEDPIVVQGLDHFYGEGALRRQILFDVSLEVHAGEIVILTGPSGSGKTILLTLIGALRSAQAGSLRVLGRELHGAGESALALVRRRIGYVFQQHNLLDSLSALQNVQMSVQLDGELEPRAIERSAAEALSAVGLTERAHAHPSELSGGERQRVAIARALARKPQIVLADEPTASLDRETGRAIVDILQKLARRDAVTVVLVTHDSRVLDVADRILAMEDGRLSSFLGWVGSDTRHRLRLLVEETRRGKLAERVGELDEGAFGALLDTLTEESRRLLEVADLVQSDAFESLLGEFVGAFEARVRDRLRARSARLLFTDEDGHNLFALARCEHGTAHEVAVGSARAVRRPQEQATSGVLSVPVADSQGRAFAELEVSDPVGRDAFDVDDRDALAFLAQGLGSIVESWWRMSCDCRRNRAGELRACCAAAAASTPRTPA
jgi:putative ABC transport system ATP-binding protein